MTDSERAVFSRLAWFPVDSVVLDVDCRPLSLGSEEAVGLMGLRVLDRGAELSPAEEWREVRAYVWLHSEEVDVVSRALWSGAWRSLLEEMPELGAPELAALAEWREIREAVLSAVEASRVTVKPRPKSGKDETPSAVTGPGMLAHKVAVIGMATGMGPREVLWDLPLAWAEQVYHARMRWEGAWTVPAVARSGEVFDGELSVGALENDE